MAQRYWIDTPAVGLHVQMPPYSPPTSWPGLIVSGPPVSPPPPMKRKAHCTRSLQPLRRKPPT